MPRKNTSHKKSKTKRNIAKKKKPMKKAPQRQLVKKRKTSPKKTAARTKAPTQRKVGAKKKLASRKPSRKESRSVKTEPFLSEEVVARSGRQSGDLQGLSHVESADSESVNDLLEEGNAFEADVVAGVEEADASDEKEVRTHEVLGDDVPGEYLDEE